MILVLRALGIGDLATAVPALRGLRRAFPDRPLALAAPRWLSPLVGLAGCVDLVIPVDRLAPLAWPVGRPYWAVNLHGRGPESHRLLATAAPGLLCAFACPSAGHTDGPPWRQDEHEVHRWCRLLAWYGVESDPGDLDLCRPDPSRVPVGATVVHPGGKDPLRRWSPDRFAALARDLVRRGHRVVVTGSARESELAEQVAERAGLPRTAVFAGAFDVAGLAALVAHGRLVISADTGVAHLATAYRTPSVVLFGPVRPEHWGPPADRPWHRVLDGRGAGQTDGDDGLHPALAAIGVAEVVEAVEAAERQRHPAGR